MAGGDKSKKVLCCGQQSFEAWGQGHAGQSKAKISNQRYNHLDMKTRPNYNAEMWLIVANTHDFVVKHKDDIYTTIQTAMFYCNPMIPSSLCEL